jgi:hypothetical protein
VNRAIAKSDTNNSALLSTIENQLTKYKSFEKKQKQDKLLTKLTN